jgi:hypothetical protein
MTEKRFVYAQVADGVAVRIFKTHKAAIQSGVPEELLRWVVRAEAVGEIRKQVIARAHCNCDRCGRALTPDTGEMHETLPKGKGGEVSLDNCEWLCHDCHQGPDSAHGDRQLRFGEGVGNGTPGNDR